MGYSLGVMKNTTNNLLAVIGAYDTLSATPFAQAAGFENAVDAFFADHTDEEVLAFEHPTMGQIFDEFDVAEVRGMKEAA